MSLLVATRRHEAVRRASSPCTTSSLTVEEGEIRSIIGPNGAGKTTFFNCITGVYEPEEGEISFEGTRIIGRKPHASPRAGIARTFQNIRLFGNMTALENVIVGLDVHHRSGVLGALVRLTVAATPRNAMRSIARASCCAFVGIESLRRRAVAEPRVRRPARVSRSRGRSATTPKLLLLDEPAAGMNPAEKRALIDLVRKIRDDGDDRSS